MKELEELKAIFLSPDLDEEVRADNEAKIREWQQSLIQNEAFAGWRDHDITKQIAAKAKETYKDLSMMLLDRHYSEEARAGIHRQIDAIKWLLSLTEVDAKGALEQTQREIRTALSTTN